MQAIFWIGKSGLFGSLIRMFKHRGISHAELLFSDGTAGTSDADKGGVVLYRPALDPLDWITVDLPISLAAEQVVRDYVSDHVGHGYDWKGIVLSQVFSTNREDPERFFCSELCCAALKAAFPMTFACVTPSDMDPARLAKFISNRRGEIYREDRCLYA